MRGKRFNTKDNDVNLYYMNDGQDDLEDSKKKKKERKKRIKQKNLGYKSEDRFDEENETVIRMTNKNRLKKEEETRKKLTKQEIKRKKKIKKIKFVLKIILLIAIISGGVAFALTSPMFNITNIQVSGNNIVSTDTVISLSQLKKDENIFRFNSSQTINNIKENPYIESVSINRKIPSTVAINITERIPTYSVDFMEKYAYIDMQGYILEISDDSKNLPIIHGISTAEDQVVPGNRLNDADLEKLEDVIKIMDAVKQNNLEGEVKSIDISKKNEYTLDLETEGKKVHIGDSSNLSNKMLYVVAILEQEKENEGDIFVNGDLNNNFKPYFRQKIS